MCEPEMTEECRQECLGFNFSGGCNSDGCKQMAKDNCDTAPKACFKCPRKYCWYGTKHCLGCLCVCLRCDKPEDETLAEIDFNEQMKEEDKCFKDNHCLGCLFCPCFLSVAALGCVGMVMTWLGSAFCRIAGSCCKCCKNNKVSDSS